MLRNSTHITNFEMKISAKELDKYMDDEIDYQPRSKVVSKTPKRETDVYEKAKINRTKPSKNLSEPNNRK